MTTSGATGDDNFVIVTELYNWLILGLHQSDYFCGILCPHWRRMEPARNILTEGNTSQYKFSHVSTSESEPIKQIQICLLQSHSLPFEDFRFDDDQNFGLRLMWYSLCQIMTYCTQWRLSTLEELIPKLNYIGGHQCGCCTGWISFVVGTLLVLYEMTKGYKNVSLQRQHHEYG